MLKGRFQPFSIIFPPVKRLFSTLRRGGIDSRFESLIAAETRYFPRVHSFLFFLLF